MREHTIFQKIIARELPAAIHYEDEHCIVIEDIAPQAPVHLLVIPKKHIARLAQIAQEDSLLIAHMFSVIQELTQTMGVDTGFRIVINNGTSAGETVPHLHIHLLAGRPMQWPPG